MSIMEVVPRALHVNSSELPFVTVMEGMDIQLLHTDIEAGLWVIRTHFAPGIEIWRHKHTGVVHAFTHSGCWKYKEYPEINTAGSYLYEPANSIHTLITPPDNGEITDVTFVIYGANLNLDENNNVTSVFDAPLMRELYDGLLAEKGISVAPVVTGGRAYIPGRE